MIEDSELTKTLAEFVGWDDFWEADQGGRHWLIGMRPDHVDDYYALENERTALPDYLNDSSALTTVTQRLFKLGLWADYMSIRDALAQLRETVGSSKVAHLRARDRVVAAYLVIEAYKELHEPVV